MGESFYGGKQGYSFIIVKSFETVQQMVDSFKEGPKYTDVHYDEHVLINTENKNDPDNGKIYRRGHNYLNDEGGAVYVGTIVGPAGPAPMVELSTVDDIKKKNNNIDIDKWTTNFAEGEYNLKDKNLIPGKYEENGTIIYNDEIKWASCSVRDKLLKDTTVYIGFKIPYTVIDIIADSVSPYYDKPLIENKSETSHPFYNKWNIKIPKGIKGDSLQNFRVIEANDSIENYENKQNDIENKNLVLVYDQYNYDVEEDGTFKTIYIAPYKMITDVEIADDGTLTIYLSYGDNIVFDNLIEWIDDVRIETVNDTGELGTGSQKVNIYYNTGRIDEIGEPLNYILETDITEDYHYIVRYSDPIKRQNIVNNKKNYPGTDYLDLGPIKDYSGILIGLNISSEEDPSLDISTNVINKLNQDYPQGLLNNLKGKVVTVGRDNENKDFYAFDYVNNTWYLLGSLEVTPLEEMFIIGNENDISDLVKDNLKIGGVWFKTEDYNDWIESDD